MGPGNGGDGLNRVVDGGHRVNVNAGRRSLGQMQNARRSGAITFSQSGSPKPFECSPYGPPVLRRRFHHDFLDFLRDKPLRQCSKLARRCAKGPAFKLVLALDCNIGNHDRQHPLVYVNSCYSVRHPPLCQCE